MKHGSTFVSALCYSCNTLKVEICYCLCVRYLKKGGTIMIPQEQKDKVQHGEQAQSPIEGQQTPARTSSRQWVNVLLYVLGIVVPLVGGFAICFLSPSGISPYLGFWVTPILMAILGFVGARLLGSWWAMLVVPFALAIGQILGTILLYGAELEPVLLNWSTNVFFGTVPAAIGAILGILTSKSFAPGSAQYLSMTLLLSMGLYVVALGEAFLVALLLWPNAMQDNAFMTIGFLAMIFILMGSFLVLGSLISMKVHWLLAIGVFLLSLLAAFVQGWLFPSNQTIVFWFLTYGGVVVLLSLILLGRVKGVWSALWRTLLVASVGATIVIAVLVARGPDDWKYPPDGLDVLLLSLGVGALILIVGYWFARKGRPSRLTIGRS